MNITEQAHVDRLESDLADLRESFKTLLALCDEQARTIATLTAARVAVPILGELRSDRRIPQP